MDLDFQIADPAQREQLRQQALQIASLYFQTFSSPAGAQVLAIMKYNANKPAASFQHEVVIAHEARRQLIRSIEEQIEFARTGGNRSQSPWEQMQQPLPPTPRVPRQKSQSRKRKAT